MNANRPVPGASRISLVKRIFSAGGWTLLGFGTNQLVRLVGNLILTRLLFPEAFGLMAIAQAVILGTAMLSDVGLEQSIIQNKRGSEAAFLNTVWTVQILRGVLIWLILCLLAFPVASFYGEPILAQLLPAVGLTAIIGGFGSTKVATAGRNLGIARTTIIEVGGGALGVAVTVALAWIDRSIWSLVIGNVVGVCIKTAAGHIWLEGIRNRLSWDRSALGVLGNFGRWIFVSSALTFLAGEGNRLLIGSVLDVRMLAFFTLAAAVDQIPYMIAQRISNRVLFPAYSEVVRESPEELYAVVARSRMIMIAPYWIACVFFVFFGQDLMTLLYDERYHESGWMLRILALGSIVGCLSVSYNGVLWAKGLVRTSTALLAVQLFFQVPAMLAGYYFGGPKGLVLAVASVGWILYPIYAFVYSRLSMWQPKLDLPFIGLSLLVAISVLKDGLPG